MSRRLVNPTRRLSDSESIPVGGSPQKKSHNSPLLSIGLIIVGAFLLIGYFYRNSGEYAIRKEVSITGGAIRKEVSITGEGDSCTSEVQRTIPVLKKAYGANMKKVLHVGPETCSVVSKLLKEDVSEAWGVEPYELDDPDSICKSLVNKGIVRVADIKFPLPYKPESFSLVIVSDALDYLSPKYINKTLLELTRVSKKGLVVFTGFPGQQKVKISQQSKFGRMAKLRSPSWWQKYFHQSGLNEDAAATEKFKKASSKSSYEPSCQIFHLSS